MVPSKVREWHDGKTITFYGNKARGGQKGRPYDTGGTNRKEERALSA